MVVYMLSTPIRCATGTGTPKPRSEVLIHASCWRLLRCALGALITTLGASKQQRAAREELYSDFKGSMMVTVVVGGKLMVR